MPAPEDVAVFKVEPEVISVLDYTKGFGHTDLVNLPGSTAEQAKPDKRPPPASA
jgi:hypothetical protein